MQDFFILFDDAVREQAHCFEALRQTVFLAPQDLARLDGILAQARDAGLFAALAADYAFGTALHHVPHKVSGSLAVYLFARRRRLEGAEIQDFLRAHTREDFSGVTAWQGGLSRAQCLQKIAGIQAAIARGETYQINLTDILRAEIYGDAVDFYRTLRRRQRVPYGALAHLPQENGKNVLLLSFSPELFWRIEKGAVTAQPMKGTAPILGDGQDEARREALRADEKNRAENVMIVDLLRNDLGKIARTGSVRVPQQFQVEAFGSVWQMTGTVQAALREDVGAAELFAATFPCGSITGAPKRKSIEIIENIEESARGLYTGALGFLSVDKGGKLSGCLNVLIRTPVLRRNAADTAWDAEMGIGSGITCGSIGADEWDEWQSKAVFAQVPPAFSLIETLRVQNGQCALWQRHRARLLHSAQVLGFPCAPPQWDAELAAQLSALPEGVFRLRLQLLPSGKIMWTHDALLPLPEKNTFILADTPHPADPFLRTHKTDRRAPLDAALAAAQLQGAFDVLFADKNGFLLEGARSNIFARFGSQWRTPPAIGLLAGVMRAEILAQPEKYLGGGTVCETPLHISDLPAADEIVLSNALRGAVRCIRQP